jgi:hypothetical protein
MKRKTSLSVIALMLLAAVIFAAVIFYRYSDQPILKHDRQGNAIVAVIKGEFEIPIDPLTKRPGIFCGGWSYWRGFVWNAGSRITIFGVHEADIQNRIIDRIEGVVKMNNYWDVLVVFYSDAKIEHEGNWTGRIDVPELRNVRVIGKTESWTVLDDQHR